ncbi:14211_t:CDS:2 [Acaulospora colombiana]|uniref:14211_t:CDS:1 n=1 Tax=Acaulospora colombiana TaxID=27376 RepID=A0ACA9MID3_9GLOM|nr:14211_t:CDS:2 [Acaulospora colombiana]
MSPKRRNSKRLSKQNPYKRKKSKTIEPVSDSLVESVTFNAEASTTPSPEPTTKRETNHEYSLRITRSGKIRKYVEQGLNALKNKNKASDEASNTTLILSGNGPVIAKTISIVEIIKRKINDTLHQYNKISRTFVRTKDSGKEVEGESNEDIRDVDMEDYEENQDG